MVRHRLTDPQWELVQDLFPPPARTGRPRRDRREILDGIFWILRTGAPWRDLPEELGPWATTWDLFDTWNGDGTLEAILSRLRAAGIDAGVNVMPVLPGITDEPAALEALVARIAEAGATFAGACALRLRASARERYLPFVEAEFPHLAARYRRAYARGHYVSRRYRDGLARTFARLCARYGVPTWPQGRDLPDEAAAGSGPPDETTGAARESAGHSSLPNDNDGRSPAPPQLSLGLL